MADESCVSCGSEETLHPWVAIMNKADIAPDRVPVSVNGDFVAVPVCQPCYMIPTNRPIPIKGHFFARAHAGLALSSVGGDLVG
jgi:hypothetical protein